MVPRVPMTSILSLALFLVAQQLVVHSGPEQGRKRSRRGAGEGHRGLGSSLRSCGPSLAVPRPQVAIPMCRAT